MGTHDEAKPAGAAALQGAQQQRQSPMPLSQILAYTVTNLAQGVMLTMPFTVAVYMVRAFLAAAAAAAAGPDAVPAAAAVGAAPAAGASASDEAQIGRLTGLLAAAYSLSQFTTSYAWGVFSSRFGRKPVMVLGSGASCVTLLWFGLAGSFGGAAAARVVAGLLNGIIVAWKCAIGEACGPLEQGKVLSYMSLSWGIGCILGPSIGGIASAPCSSWPGLPGCGAGGLLAARPYFLPCAISAAVNAAAMCLNILVLQETLPQLVQARQQQQQQQRGGSTTARAPVAAVQAAGRAAAAWVRGLLGRGAGPAPYQRLHSTLNPHNSSSSSSSSACGPQCTGCPVCWQLWRAESGLVHAQGRQQQQQQQMLQPLRPEGSAVSLELTAVKQAWGGGSDDLMAGPQRSSDSAADQHSRRPSPAAAAAAATAVAAAAGKQGSLAGPPSRPLRPNDSASEYTLRGYKPGSGKGQEQEHNPIEQQQQQQQDHPALSVQQDHHHHQQQQQQQRWDAAPTSGPDQGSDCTIIVGTPDQQQQQQYNSDSSQHPSCSAPLLSKSVDTSDSSSSSSRTAGGGNNSSSSSREAGVEPWYRQRQVVLVLLAYGAVCLLFCAIDELTPIFASAPRQQGGLRLSEVQLAGPLSFGGACLILVSLLAFPAAQRAWGTLAVTRRGLLLAVLVALAIPCTRFFAAEPPHSDTAGGAVGGSSSAAASGDVGWRSWLLLYVAMLLKAVAGCFAFTGTMILVNTSADPAQLGAVNGVGQSLASLARGVGPAMGGLLWGLAVHLQGHVPGAQLLPFGCVAAVAVGALLLYAFVRPVEAQEEVEEGAPPRHGTSCCQE